MKNLFLILLLSFIIPAGANSQVLLGFETIPGKDETDYRKDEPKALEAAVYILSSKIDETDTKREQSINYLLMWMEGTPDYMFYIDEDVYLYTRSKKDLLEVYMACLTKNILEDPELTNDRTELKFRSVELFLGYCRNPENSVKPFRELERLEKASDRGRLRAYVGE